MDESENQNNSFKKLGTKYLLSVMAACVAEFVTYPLDLTKTRLQLQGEVAAGEKHVKYRGMFQTAKGIAIEEVNISITDRDLTKN